MRSPATMRMHVEQLVLTGWDARAGERIGQALRGELERLVAGGAGWTVAGSDPPVVHGAAIELSPDATAEATGREIARAVYEGLSS